PKPGVESGIVAASDEKLSNPANASEFENSIDGFMAIQHLHVSSRIAGARQLLVQRGPVRGRHLRVSHIGHSPFAVEAFGRNLRDLNHLFGYPPLGRRRTSVRKAYQDALLRAEMLGNSSGFQIT